MVSPSIIALYDRLAERYDHLKDAVPASRIREQVLGGDLSRLIGQLVPDRQAVAGRRALDLGGGTGRWAVWLARQGWQVTLLDPSAGMTAVARDKIRELGLADRVQVITADTAWLDDQPAGTYELVLAVGGVFSYTAEPATALARVYRAAAPGAALFGDVENVFAICDPHRARTWAEVDAAWREYRTNLGEDGAGGPVWLYDTPRLNATIEGAGWYVADVWPLGVCHFLLGDEVLADAVQRDLARIVQLEGQMARQAGLQASAYDLAYIARKPG